MKTNLPSTLLCLCLLTSALGPPAFAQGTAFTYQGQLDHLGGPANGTFDLSFSLWTGPVGPGQVGNILTNANVTVSNGLATVTLDFGAGIFTGADRWLEIATRTNGSGPFTILVPRQQLTPAPYAITAANLAGSVSGGGLSGIYSNAISFSNAANTFLGTFTGNGASVTGLNATNISTGTLPDARLSANVALLNSIQTFTADKTFGGGAKIFVDPGSAAAPGQSFSGDPNTGTFSPGADTIALATAGTERIRISSAGDVGIGTASPEARLHVMDGSAGTVTANGSSIAVLERSGIGYLTLLSPIANENGILFGSPTNSSDGGIIYNNSGTLRGLQFRAGGNNTRMVIQADGKVGIGTTTPDGPLDITTPVNTNCSLRLTSGGSWPLILNQSPSSIFSISNGGVARLIITPGGFVGVGRTATTNDLEVEGTASKTTAGSWLANSDARIKTGVHTVTNALATLSRVRLVQFHYTDEYRAAHPGIVDREYLNVVAQEFQEVFPGQVQRSGEKLANGENILQVDSYPLTIYSAAAVQELNRRVEELESELKRRDAENAELKRGLEELKTIVGRLAPRPGKEEL